MPDKSLYVAMTVRFLPEGEYLIVDVQPTIARFNIGMPVLEPIDPTQIDVPGWLTGKVDLVAWEIHQVLLPYLVKGVTGSTPEPPPYVPADAGPEPDYVPLVPHTIEL
jgi:hypothetical protein